MLFEKAQKEIFTALAKGNRVRGCVNDKGDFIVTTEGYVAFVIPAAVVAFNADRIIRVDTLANFFCDVNQENEIKMTPFTRNVGFKERVHIFDNHGELAYVNEKYLMYWHNPTYYQERGNTVGTITVTEKMYSKETHEVENVPVGLIIPMRCGFTDYIGTVKEE